ncbi:ParB/RepB/Spo0J family partition protein [Kitasatospora sp. NPDC087861]|uniref:ParB/RepB/Spo0J family partition protein n=1 Tax=Kitasatospora sp. NPDC087861 TaxID=3364070 RepID=UPI00381DE4AC
MANTATAPATAARVRRAKTAPAVPQAAPAVEAEPVAEAAAVEAEPVAEAAAVEAEPVAEAAAVEVWPAFTVVDLLAHPGNTPGEPDAELTASIAEHGITDPLHITLRSDGTPHVQDGLRRLAAARAAGLESVPYSPVPQIRVTALTAHTRNLRKGLHLDEPFVESIRERGVDIRLILVPGEDGSPVVVDGHRRLAGAVEAGRTHVPYEMTRQDAAEQILTMLRTAVHRRDLTADEQMDGLFELADLGADPAAVAAASGRTKKEVKALAEASQAAPVKALRRAVPGVTLTLGQMDELGELDGVHEAQAAEEIAKAASDDKATANEVTWIIKRAKARQDAAAKLAAQLAELEAAGARLREEAELSEKASTLHSLRDGKGKGFTAEHHAATCRGAIWVRRTGSDTYTQMCANPDLYGHKRVLPNEGKPRKSAAEQAAIKRGNEDWAAATEIRRAWLTAYLAKGRKYTAAEQKAMTEALAVALLPGGCPSISGRHGDHRTLPTLVALLGVKPAKGQTTVTRADIAKLCDRATSARLTALSLATILACGEMDSTREAWRTEEGADNGRRTKARAHLTLLITLGYPPVGIEQAVLQDKPYKA